jgi:peroxiredoxin Q/BCP
MYGKTYEGTMRYSYIVDENGTVKKIFRKVKVAEHANELLDAIEELGM